MILTNRLRNEALNNNIDSIKKILYFIKRKMQNDINFISKLIEYNFLSLLSQFLNVYYDNFVEMKNESLWCLCNISSSNINLQDIIGNEIIENLIRCFRNPIYSNQFLNIVILILKFFKFFFFVNLKLVRNFFKFKYNIFLCFLKNFILLFDIIFKF